MSETGRERVVRPEDGFERLDAWVGRLEAGVLTFSLLAMSLTFFLKIVFENAIANRSFVDNLLLRWLHNGSGPVPQDLLERVHGVWSPTLAVVVVWLAGMAAARARADWPEAGVPDQARATAPAFLSLHSFVWGLVFAAAFLLVMLAVVHLPPTVLCAVLYLAFVAVFGMRAHAQGAARPYWVTWGLLSVPIGILLWRIPAQYAWVNDLAKVLIMYVGFFGASLASRDRRHVALNFGRRLWPTRSPRLAESLHLATSLVFVGLLLALSVHLFLLQWRGGSRLAILWVPEYHIVLPVVLGFLLITVRTAADLVRTLRGMPLARLEGVASPPAGGDVP